MAGIQTAPHIAIHRTRLIPCSMISPKCAAPAGNYIFPYHRGAAAETGPFYIKLRHLA